MALVSEQHTYTKETAIRRTEIPIGMSQDSTSGDHLTLTYWFQAGMACTLVDQCEQRIHLVGEDLPGEQSLIICLRTSDNAIFKEGNSSWGREVFVRKGSPRKAGSSQGREVLVRKGSPRKHSHP